MKIEISRNDRKVLIGFNILVLYFCLYWVGYLVSDAFYQYQLVPEGWGDIYAWHPKNRFYVGIMLAVIVFTYNLVWAFYNTIALRGKK